MLRRAFTWLSLHGYVLAVLAIGLSTALFLPGRDVFAKGQWALLYLLIVVLVAGASGAGPAVLAAVLAFFAWDFFFLPPYHTLTVRDPKDWLSLVAFLAVGVVMGVQTGRMRDREARALAREHETAALNRLSAGLVSQASTGQMAETILGEIVGPARRRFGDAVRRRGRRPHHVLRHAAAPTSPTAARRRWPTGSTPTTRPSALPHQTALDPTEAPGRGFQGARRHRRHLPAAAQRDRRGRGPERGRPQRTSAPTTTPTLACWPRSPTWSPPSSSASACRGSPRRPKPCARPTA